jgi:uncharacterized NAD(P)/FAD-binding protein YdhS
MGVMSATKVENTLSVVIIGAGFSGTLTAIQLMRSYRTPLAISLIDPRGVFGPGLAYSVPSDRFKLNVRAKAMGAFPDAPGHFLEWAQLRDPTIHGDTFVSRRLYGEYLQELLANTIRDAVHHRCVCSKDEAISVTLSGDSSAVLVGLASGLTISTDACVVALGNLIRTPLQSSDTSAVFRSPYLIDTYGDLSEKRSLAIIGTGLSAVDAILEAEGRGFTGRYEVISRHGRFPLAHEELHHLSAKLPERWYELGSVLELLRLVRRLSREAGSSQPVFDAMRPHIQQMWSNLGLAERRRFLRHIRPIWDVHRHRTPLEHRQLLSALEAAGRLTLRRGRMVHALQSGSGVAMSIESRGVTSTLTTDAAILCAGPEGDMTKTSHPLAASILALEHLTPSSLGLGLEEGSRPATSRVFLIGPLQRHGLWEITAVRELRAAAAQLAVDIGTVLELDRQ